MTPIVKITVGESRGHDLAGCGLLALLPNVPVCSRSTFSEAVSVLADWGLKCSPLLGIWETQILLGCRSSPICLSRETKGN